MVYGLSEKTIKGIQGVFAEHPQIEQAILYGSRAKGNYRNGSDIDLVLVGPELDLSQIFKIEIKLDDLMLPYKIDLFALHKIENQDLINHINRVGIVFFEKTH
ncbi:nucleotidyltransferase domain-containing protein [Dyadobacter sandarakinus]|uniref:Nucleotidyltransferase domain-containing protein n=1 Tax=Dyadobacter sandarakinus TaxID=2747268 RepID=A0ABX7I1U8_9BACT|nr:nucleotidyltransferase domain-containing protein [Dyadobacter sandarakinus]QRQ99511.1 nucleotidyltransferase domain-containing protein [Dyadobacter sandarakinus]